MLILRYCLLVSARYLMSELPAYSVVLCLQCGLKLNLYFKFTVGLLISLTN